MTVIAHWKKRHFSATAPALTGAQAPPWRIRSSLALLVAACMLPGVLLSAYFIVSDYRQHKAQAVAGAIATARAAAASLDRDLASIEAGLRMLAAASALAANDLPGFYVRARKALPYQNISNFVLIDSAGRQQLNTFLPWGAPLPTTGSAPALQRVFESDQRVLTDVFLGPVTGKPILAMGVPVQRDGKTVYSLNAGILPQRIASVLAAQHLPKTWIGVVLDSTGHIVGRTHEMDHHVGKLAVPDLVRMAHESQEGVLETVTLEGIPVITAFSRSQVSDWSVGVGVPRSELTDGLWQSMLVLIGASTLIFAVAMGVAWHLAMQRVVRPADSLLRRMRLMSQGEDPGASACPHASQEFVVLDQGFANMSAQLKLREKEREAKLAAEAANRAKTEFLSRMSHELRTPLNAVLGFAQVLKMDPFEPLSKRQEDMVQQIVSSGQHLLNMISDVLDVSRIETGAMQLTITDIDANEMLSECQQMVANDASSNDLNMTVLLPVTHALVKADKTRLKQVLLNLLSNAIKYNRPGGEVQLSAEVMDGHVRFCVQDTGIGMSPLQTQRLFQPFNRLGRENTTTPGTGIGLVISKRLLEVMGSNLCLESATNKGSKFWFDLPIAG
jgi:two-component system sensor histidine kinase/response regulator